VISVDELRVIAKARFQDANILVANERPDGAYYIADYAVGRFYSMDNLAEKLRVLEGDIAAERGSLNLFALLEREDLSDRWDLVISAPWAREDEATLKYVADAVKRHLEPAEVTRLSRIVILDADQDPVRAITDTYDVEYGRVEIAQPARFGLPVKQGYIITSRRAA
jgi:hypothetical protein